MKKYYVQNNKIIINRFCVQYTHAIDNGYSQSVSEVIQYAKNQDELNAITNELTRENIDFNITELDVSDILQYDGIFVSSTEEARKIIEPTLQEVKDFKISEVSKICNEKIFDGIDVDLSQKGIKHFSLKYEDQINLNRLSIIHQNCSDDCLITYHADGEVYETFSKDEFS